MAFCWPDRTVTTGRIPVFSRFLAVHSDSNSSLALTLARRAGEVRPVQNDSVADKVLLEPRSFRYT